MSVLKDIKIYKGAPIPLGVSVTANGVQFAVAVPGAKECILKLYKKKSKVCESEYKLDESFKTGSVFSCILSANDIESVLTKEYEYVYEINGKKFVDPYAARISGRDRFGKVSDLVRAGFDLIPYDWEGDVKLGLHYDEMIMYQLHVRGFTKDASSGVTNRGTFSGLEEKISYMKSIGINAVLLLPAYDFDEIMREEVPLGAPQNITDMLDNNIVNKINYWGYTDKCAYFAPKASYAAKSSECIEEFKHMVKSLHMNGIEVYMDMHFSGENDYGMIIDCLRHWVVNYHIDGFRINQNVVPEALVKNDPVLSDVKYIGTYWHDKLDANHRLADCNDGFMVAARRLLKGEEDVLSEYVRYHERGYCGSEVVNYVADVNGFTLMDCVSYERKHNEKNGDNGTDGTDYNYSYNYGVEGPTKKKIILNTRNRQIKNAFTLMFISYGTPMILAGDEFGNSQSGNNNAYCQDNKVSWLDWRLCEKNSWLVDYVRKLVEFRKAYVMNSDSRNKSNNFKCDLPILSYHGIFPWYPDYAPYNRAIGIMVSKTGVYTAINMNKEDMRFELPFIDDKKSWEVLLSSCDNVKPIIDNERNQKYKVSPRSISIFVRK